MKSFSVANQNTVTFKCIDNLAHFHKVFGVVFCYIQPCAPASEHWLRWCTNLVELVAPILVLHGHRLDFWNEIVNLLEVAAHFLSAVVQKMRGRAAGTVA